MRIFNYHKDEYGFWFRLFGYGITVNDRSKYPAPFSIRYGYRKELRIGKYGIQILKP